MTDYRERAEAFFANYAKEVNGKLFEDTADFSTWSDELLASEFAAVAAERDAVWRERLERLAGELEESPPFWRHVIEVFSGYDGEREVGKRIASRLRELLNGNEIK